MPAIDSVLIYGLEKSIASLGQRDALEVTIESRPNAGENGPKII